MKVRIDDQIFSLQSRGGISRYFAELIRAFRTDPSLGITLTTGRLWTRNHHLTEVGLGHPPQTPLSGLPAFLRRANRSQLREPSDITHHTYYRREYLTRFSGPRVVTVFDMIPELHTENVRVRNPHRSKREFVAAADLILCISESTKGDMLDAYGEQSAPVVVTHLGVSETFKPGMEKPSELPERYCVFVGKRHRYKDFRVLARAMSLAQLPSDIKLVLVGGEPIRAREQIELRRLGIADRVIGPMRIDDEALSRVYGHALAMVFPSRWEGFGLPTVEAMASGCPVILADSSVHPEIGGTAALYFAAGDAGQLAEILREVVASEELRRRLSAEGLVRAASFGWSETAKRTAAAYRGVVADS